MKISVVLPNYNHAAFLAQAIEGVQAQTYTDWELLVVDDGSTDESRQIIERYATRDRCIVPIFLPKNRGAMEAVRIGIARATAPLLFAIAADDYISEPRFFELAVTAFERFPQAAGIFACATMVNGKDDKKLWRMGSYNPIDLYVEPAGKSALQNEAAPPPLMQFIPPREAAATFLSHRMFIPGAAAVWKRASVADLGGYDKQLGPQSDYFLNHALAALHGVVFIDMPVTVARSFKDSYSNSSDDNEFFRRHALVEKKLRALDLPYEVNEEIFTQWRTGIIEGRTSESFQRQLFLAVQRLCGHLQPWELRAFTPEVATFIVGLRQDCVRLENELDHRAQMAQQIFTEVVSSIDPPPPKTGPAQKISNWWQRTWA